MFREMKRIFSIVCLAAAAATMMAVPAKRGAILRIAEDGTQKEVYLHGDEHFHFMTDAEGNWLDEKTLKTLSAEQKEARLDAGIGAKARRAAQPRKVGTELNLAPRGLIILAQAKDVKFTTPFDTLKNMLTGDHFTRHYDYNYVYNSHRYKGTVNSSGSAKQYFNDQSWGQYQPVFDVVGPVTASKNMEYYGQDDDVYASDLIEEACRLADSEFDVDFTLYDNDDDGEVDFVYVIYAGYGAADGGGENTIWPHSSSLWNVKLDNKYIGKYACSNELNFTDKQYAGIGTFCHEFSHVLGLPDFYATNNATHHTLGDWDIMDYGPYNNEGNTPPAYSAYERFFMGWLTPRVLTEPESVWLGKLNPDTTALLMCEGDSHNMDGLNPSPKTFYMLENRALMDWDVCIPGAGLLITKVTYNRNKWSSNTVNNSSSSMGVDIMEAKTNNTRFGAATDAYPAGAKAFTKFTDHEITNIELDEHGSITFSYRGAEKTPIEQVETGHSAQKIVRDGQVLILRGDKIYDLNGRQL